MWIILFRIPLGFVGLLVLSLWNVWGMDNQELGLDGVQVQLEAIRIYWNTDVHSKSPVYRPFFCL